MIALVREIMSGVAEVAPRAHSERGKQENRTMLMVWKIVRFRDQTQCGMIFRVPPHKLGVVVSLLGPWSPPQRPHLR